MKTRVWKYWRTARLKKNLEEAKRLAPHDFKFYSTTMGEYVFRRKLIPNGPTGAIIEDVLNTKSPT